MVETHILYFKQINEVTVEYIQKNFLVYSWLEFPLFVEVIIQRGYNISLFDLRMEFLFNNLSYPFEIFNIDSRKNRYIYPSCSKNTKCIKMYTKKIK